VNKGGRGWKVLDSVLCIQAGSIIVTQIPVHSEAKQKKAKLGWD
jgi:hypothetical protein